MSSPLLSPSSKALHVGAAQVSGPEQNLLEGLDLLVSDPARNFLLPVSVRDVLVSAGLEKKSFVIRLVSNLIIAYYVLA